MDIVSLPNHPEATNPLNKNLLRYVLAAIDISGKLSNAGDNETVLSA